MNEGQETKPTEPYTTPSHLLLQTTTRTVHQPI